MCGVNDVSRGGSKFVGKGVSVSRSLMSFYLGTVGGRHMCRSTYRKLVLAGY